MDVTSLTRAEARQRLLVAELQHRTRNLLGVVQPVAQRTLSDDERIDTFQQRLATLGRVQSLIAHAAQRSIDLGEIVRAELHAFAVPEDERIRVAGPPVPLNMEHVQIVALVLHELTTNAVKHGALVHSGGRLRVEWSIRAVPEGGRCLVLLWQESGVPIAAPPNRSSYGRELIERALSLQPGRPDRTELRPGWRALRHRDAAGGGGMTLAAAVLRDRRILVWRMTIGSGGTSSGCCRRPAPGWWDAWHRRCALFVTVSRSSAARCWTSTCTASPPGRWRRR
jgi:two-component sensor histidine kinase